MNNRGMALALAMMVILVLVTIGSAFFQGSVMETVFSNNFLSNSRAFWLAEAGRNKGLYELNRNNCAGCVRCGTATACANCACAGFNKCIAGTLTTGDYDVTINSVNSYINSTGSAPSRSALNAAKRSVQMDLTPNSYAILAKNPITVANGALIDSYNSTQGSYGGYNIGTRGNIATNSNAIGAIIIGNNAQVKGNANTGPTGTVVLNVNANLTGSTTRNTITIASVTVPSNLTSLANGGAYSVSTNAMKTINTGNYRHTSVTLSNNARLTINGNVNMYITNAGTALSTGTNAKITISSGAKLTVYTNGIFSIANNAAINNTNSAPASCIIYSTYAGATGINLGNNGPFYGVIYAPDTNITVSNNADSYGMYVGKGIIFSNNANVHCDETLTSIVSTPGITARNWHEL